MAERRDYRSAEAAAWRKHYQTARWKQMRANQLAAHPLCERCQAEGRFVAATVANHRKPHKGDLVLFFEPTNLESTCKPHHDGTIQREEHAGFSGMVDTDGWPTDERHRANKGESMNRRSFFGGVTGAVAATALTIVGSRGSASRPEDAEHYVSRMFATHEIYDPRMPRGGGLLDTASAMTPGDWDRLESEFA